MASGGPAEPESEPLRPVVESAGPAGFNPLSADNRSAAQAIQPAPQTAAGDPAPPPRPPVDRATAVEDTPDASGAAQAARPEARAMAAVASGSPPPALQPPPPPPSGPTPLRPLAERTSRPLETSVPVTGEAPRADAAAPVKVAVVAPEPAAPARLPSPMDTASPAAATTQDGAPAEFAPAADDAAAQAETPAVSREAALSQVSRGAIEATAQIAAQILRRLEGRSTRFEMALTPEELGRVDVKLDIDSEGRLNARLAFDNPAAATDLRGRVDELRRQLEDAGFHLAEDAFEFAERDSGSSAFDRGQDARDGQSRAFAAAARLNAEIDVIQPPRWMALSLSPTGVDMKV